MRVKKKNHGHSGFNMKSSVNGAKFIFQTVSAHLVSWLNISHTLDHAMYFVFCLICSKFEGLNLSVKRMVEDAS